MMCATNLNTDHNSPCRRITNIFFFRWSCLINNKPFLSESKGSNTNLYVNISNVV